MAKNLATNNNDNFKSQFYFYNRYDVHEFLYQMRAIMGASATWSVRKGTSAALVFDLGIRYYSVV